jgi:hypothetical protein
METRSQTTYEKNALFEVNIDFDNASADWKENKKSIGNGQYKYICTKKNKNNKNCGRNCELNKEFCKIHSISINHDNK